MGIELWEVLGIDVKEIVKASNQWEAWGKALRDRPESVGLIVTARKVHDSWEETIGIHGVGLLKRWGYYELARQLDQVAIANGLGSVYDKYPNEP